MERAEHLSLATVTSLAIGGPARYCLTIGKSDEAPEALRFAQAQSLPWVVLGAGRSTLVSDEGIDGVVLRCRGTARQYLPAGAMIFAGDDLGMIGSVGGAVVSGEIPLTDIAELHWMNDRGVAQIIPSDRWVAMGVQHAPGMLLGIVPKRDIPAPAVPQHPSGPSARVFQPANGDAASSIADVGWSGKALGKACLWVEDPTWMTVQPGATANEVVQLMSLVKQQVRDTLGVQLRDAISYLGM